MRTNLLPPPATYNSAEVSVKHALPLTINVAVGAYLNVIRSSLDILASTLATRHHMMRQIKPYFPIARSEAIFLSGRGYKGHEFVQALPQRERAAIVYFTTTHQK